MVCAMRIITVLNPSMNKRFVLDTAYDFNSEIIKEKKKIDRIRKKSDHKAVNVRRTK